jgi:hypothetical protein
MEVRIVEEAKSDEKREVPLIPCGIYRLKDGCGPFYRILIKRGDEWGTFDVEDGECGLVFQDAESMKEALAKYGAVYVPNAYLVIPKECD